MVVSIYLLSNFKKSCKNELMLVVFASGLGRGQRPLPDLERVHGYCRLHQCK
jgi:hypothetical protein